MKIPGYPSLPEIQKMSTAHVLRKAFSITFHVKKLVNDCIRQQNELNNPQKQQ